MCEGYPNCPVVQNASKYTLDLVCAITNLYVRSTSIGGLKCMTIGQRTNAKSLYIPNSDKNQILKPIDFGFIASFR